MLHWLLRKRIPSEPVTGANFRIQQGAFGIGQPIFPVTVTDGSGFEGIYSYHQGDLFTPGAQNYVFESNFELPLQTLWGHGFLPIPQYFNPLQPPQVVANQTLYTNGYGGLQAGQMALQPLIESEFTGA